MIRVILVLLLMMSVAPVSTTLRPVQAEQQVPAGFNIEVFYPGLTNPTSMTWGQDGNLYVSQEGGEVIELTLGSDGFPIGSSLLAKVQPTLLGLVFAGPDLYLSTTGSVIRLTLENGKVSTTKVVLNGLPYGRHQNDEIVYGKDGFLYMGIGSTGDRTNGNDQRSATIVRFKPDGSGFEVFAKGLRNPYGLAFDRDGNLFATDNGPDDPAGPDELNYIVQGGDYGFPNYFGTPPNGSKTIGPVTNLQVHSSSDGFTFYYGDKFPAEYVGNAFIAQWGANSGDPNIGKRIVRVPITRTDHQFVGHEIVFATGFDHPLDVIDDHRGGLLVADYGAGIIYQISHGPTTSAQSSTLLDTSAIVAPTATTLETFPVEFVLLIVVVILGVGLFLATRRAGKTSQ